MTNGAGYLSEDDCRLAGLIDVVSEKTVRGHLPAGR
jgi:hypothetical protein